MLNDGVFSCSYLTCCIFWLDIPLGVAPCPQTYERLLIRLNVRAGIIGPWQVESITTTAVISWSVLRARVFAGQRVWLLGIQCVSKNTQINLASTHFGLSLISYQRRAGSFPLAGSPDEIILECCRFWVGWETTNKWLWFYTQSHLTAGISCTSDADMIYLSYLMHLECLDAWTLWNTFLQQCGNCLETLKNKSMSDCELSNNYDSPLTPMTLNIIL